MAYFLQQLVNGIALGSIYGLIAIGYTMVYGIVGMINFAHGDIFMVGAFIALIAFLLIMSLGLTLIPLALVLVLIIAMLLTAMWGWTVERIAYRPLRESFRLAPLITAIGMSIILQNFIQIAHGVSGFQELHQRVSINIRQRSAGLYQMVKAVTVKALSQQMGILIAVELLVGWTHA